MNSTIRRFLCIALAVVVAAGSAFAAPKGVRSSAKSSVSSGKSSNTNRNVNKNTNVNRNTNVNKNTNVNVNKNVNVDVDVDHHGGHYGGCCYHDHHPVAAIAGAIVTAAVIGSIVSTLPPSCSTVIVNGFAYQQCGNSWYQPQISGSSTTYIVVNAPR